MPYIAPDRRYKFDPSIEELQHQLQELGNVEGDLNYVISRLIGSAFQNETRYHVIARVRGVLKDVGDEFYRRLGGPYEDQAIAKNGDIPEYEALSQKLLATVLEQIHQKMEEASGLDEEEPTEEEDV